MRRTSEKTSKNASYPSRKNASSLSRKSTRKTSRKPPAYRQRKGYDQAIVTLTDSRTGKRRDYWLGEFGSPESRELYYRLLAEWESSGQRLPAPPNATATRNPDGKTVSEIILAYWEHAQGYYRSVSEVGNIKVALRLLRQFYGSEPAADFGPQKLRLLRERMVLGDNEAQPPRQSWCRRYTNHQVKRIRRMFKWAVAHEKVPVEVHQRLATLESLKRGRSAAKESLPVQPVPIECVHAIEPYLRRQVWAIIQLQILTGARGGELVILRPCDINRDDPAGVWLYEPIEHKTAYRGKRRTILLGPQAQEIIQPFLLRSPDAYCFSPAEAEAERRVALHALRKTPLSCGNKPGSNRKESPIAGPGDRYDSGSYCRAIQYACDKAFTPPPPLAKRSDETWPQHGERLTKKQHAEFKAWQKAHRWHPHQLRHLAGTEIRRRFGLEAAQVVLGHTSAEITDAVYAQRDLVKAMEVMKAVG